MLLGSITFLLFNQNQQEPQTREKRLKQLEKGLADLKAEIEEILSEARKSRELDEENAKKIEQMEKSIEGLRKELGLVLLQLVAKEAKEGRQKPEGTEDWFDNWGESSEPNKKEETGDWLDNWGEQ